ncbi:MAG TPA: glycoside hydrolase family 20 zincin-like fold domain-containing protein, partial [Niastella sp.]|nr:glycoside hydrolase family 20 zincin-like fold domain-containing protein [Niastella sp.]
MKGFLVLVVSVLTLNTSWASDKPVEKDVTIVTANNSPRIKYGAEKLSNALRTAGYKVVVSAELKLTATGTTIVAGNYSDALVKKAVASLRLTPDTTGKEGFSIKGNAKAIIIAGTDASGTLYGCMELAEQVADKKMLPATLSLTDKPEM